LSLLRRGMAKSSRVRKSREHTVPHEGKGHVRLKRIERIVGLCGMLYLGGCSAPASDVDGTLGVARSPLTMQEQLDQAVWADTSFWDKTLAIGVVAATESGVSYYTKHATVPSNLDNYAFRLGSISKTFTGTLYGLQGKDRSDSDLMAVRRCSEPKPI